MQLSAPSGSRSCSGKTSSKLSAINKNIPSKKNAKTFHPDATKACPCEILTQQSAKVTKKQEDSWSCGLVGKVQDIGVDTMNGHQDHVSYTSTISRWNSLSEGLDASPLLFLTIARDAVISEFLKSEDPVWAPS